MYAMPNDSLVGAATEWDRRRARSNGWLRRAVYSSARDLDDAWPRERRSASLLRRRQPPSPSLKFGLADAMGAICWAERTSGWRPKREERMRAGLGEEEGRMGQIWPRLKRKSLCTPSVFFATSFTNGEAEAAGFGDPGLSVDGYDG
uniref:Uncharacterized protein n=1 Tax=Oryza nivara TaxID=4536 RepID=A0A0E0J500_ORYNI